MVGFQFGTDAIKGERHGSSILNHGQRADHFSGLSLEILRAQFHNDLILMHMDMLSNSSN